MTCTVWPLQRGMIQERGDSRALAALPSAVLHGGPGQGGVDGCVEGPHARPDYAHAGRTSGGHKGRSAAHQISEPVGHQGPGEVRSDQHNQVCLCLSVCPIRLT